MADKKLHDWSANLEATEYENNKDLTIEDAIKAINETAPNYSVNLVTHESLGHPDTYLLDILGEKFQDKITTRYVAQCGCGGHVLKVTVL